LTSLSNHYPKDSDTYRRERLYREETDLVLFQHEAELKGIYTAYSYLLMKKKRSGVKAFKVSPTYGQGLG